MLLVDGISLGTAHNHVRLGSGLHSAVYGNRLGQAVKFCHYPDPWPVYIEWADKNGYMGNLAPMVYAIRPIGPNGAYFAIMEKFEKTLAQAHMSEVASYFDLAAGMFKRDLSIVQRVVLDKFMPGWEEFTAKLMERWSSMGDIGSNNMMLRADGTIALTDPLGGSSDKSRRWRRSGRVECAEGDRDW